MEVAVDNLDVQVHELVKRLAVPQPPTSVGDQTNTPPEDEQNDEEELKACEAVLESLHERISASLEPENHTPAINHLSPEIFVTILEHVVPRHQAFGPSFSPHNTFGEMGQLRQVCRSWTRLIDQTPVLWTSVSSQCSRGWTERILRLSQDSSLSLYAQAYSTNEEFLKVVSPHVGRCQALNLGFDSQYEEDSTPNPSNTSLLKLLQSPLPRLTKCRLDCSGAEPPLDAFFGGAPHLRKLDLMNPRKHMRPRLWPSGLRALFLRNTTMALSTLTGLFRSCPLLSQLELDNLELTYSSVWVPHLSRFVNEYESISPVPLNRLLQLELTFPAPEPMCSILSSIAAPRCKWVDAFLSTWDSTTELPPVMDSWFAKMASNLGEGPLAVVCREGTFTIGGRSMSYRSFDSSGRDAIHTLPWYMAFASRLSPETRSRVTSVCLDSFAGGLPFLEELDNLFPKLARLSISPLWALKREAEAFKYLGGRVEVSRAPRLDWIFPNLTELEFGDDGDAFTYSVLLGLLSVLVGRTAAQLTPKDWPPPVAEFKKVVLHKMQRKGDEVDEPDLLRQIAAAVPNLVTEQEPLEYPSPPIKDYTIYSNSAWDADSNLGFGLFD